MSTNLPPAPPLVARLSTLNDGPVSLIGRVDLMRSRRLRPPQHRDGEEG